MKKTSQQLLLLAYPALRKNFSITYEHIKLLHSQLSPSGRRSLIYHLEDEGYLLKEKVLNHHTVTLTSKGVRQCERLFPAFSTSSEEWQGEWELIVFLSAPKNDPEFRYLRNILLEEKAIAISRGVYGVPGTLPVKVEETLEKLYQQSVAVFTVSDWRFGSEQQFVRDTLGLIDVAEGYSGISSEIRELLKKCENTVRLTDRQKIQFVPVFNRFWEIVTEDTGSHRFYYPNSPTALEILSQLQQLLLCLYPNN